MMPTATRAACLFGAGLLLATTACGQDLDLGPLMGSDGLTLPPPQSATSPGRCLVNDPAALRPPERCLPFESTTTVKTNDGPTIAWTVITEVCVVSGDGKVYDALNGPNHHSACPIGVYWKLAPRPFHHPPLTPLFPPDATFPDAAAFEQSVAVYRQTDPEKSGPDQWWQPFVSPGFETIPRTVQVLPEREAVFVTLDPRTGKNEMFWVMLSFRDLYPGAEAPGGYHSGPPGAIARILNVAAGNAPVIEKRIEARQELGLQVRFRDTAAARP